MFATPVMIRSIGKPKYILPQIPGNIHQLQPIIRTFMSNSPHRCLNLTPRVFPHDIPKDVIQGTAEGGGQELTLEQLNLLLGDR